MPAGSRRSALKGGTKFPTPLTSKSSTAQTPTSVPLSSLHEKKSAFYDGKKDPLFSAPDDDLTVSLPTETLFIFEVFVFLYSLVALFLQHLHLYRSVWWLPHSYNFNTVNFYLIDTNVILFSSLILGRRVIWMIIKSIIQAVVPTNWLESVIIVMRSVTTFAILMTLLNISYIIVHSHPIVNILYLAYPMSVYFLLFGFAGEPFLDLFPWNTSEALLIFLKSMQYTLTDYFTGSPEQTRFDFTMFKENFNMRRKQALFNSITSAYYSTFIPCCFTPSALHYDVLWVGRHIFSVWVGLFTLYVFHCFSARYNHVMHRVALQLGFWTKIEGRLSPNFYSQWTPNTFWKNGQIVRYGKNLYKAEGNINTAEPGNVAHAKIYLETRANYDWRVRELIKPVDQTLFKNPSVPLFFLLVVQATLIIYQQVSLTLCTYWYQLISEAILLFANFNMLYKLFLNYNVLVHLYDGPYYVSRII